MKTFLFAAPLALAAASVLATPATAAPLSQEGRKIGQEITQLDRQINRAEQRRLISAREAGQLTRKVDNLQRLHARYGRDGFSRAELRALDQQVGSVKRQIDREIGDRNGRPGKHRR